MKLSEYLLEIKTFLQNILQGSPQETFIPLLKDLKSFVSSSIIGERRSQSCLNLDMINYER